MKQNYILYIYNIILASFMNVSLSNQLINSFCINFNFSMGTFFSCLNYKPFKYVCTCNVLSQRQLYEKFTNYLLSFIKKKRPPRDFNMKTLLRGALNDVHILFTALIVVPDKRGRRQNNALLILRKIQPNQPNISLPAQNRN